jgi:hypothetical protein
MQGHYLSASFATKAETRAWAAQTEADIASGKIKGKSQAR